MTFRDSILFQRSPPKYVESSGQPAKRRFRTKTQFFLMHRVHKFTKKKKYRVLNERVPTMMSVYEDKTDLYFFRALLNC